MEIELIEKKLQTAESDERQDLALEILDHIRTVQDEIAQLQALGGHILNLCNGLSEEREKLERLLRRI